MFFRYHWLRLKRPLQRFFVWMLPLPLFALVLVFPGYNQLKLLRAERFLAQSIALTELPLADPELAYEKALSAHFMAPQNSEIALNLARRASDINHPFSVRWWDQAITLSKLQPADVAQLLETALNLKENTWAFEQFQKIGQQLPDNPRSWKLVIRLLRAHLRYTEAITFVQSLFAQGKDDWFLHETLVDLSFSIPSLQSKQLAREHLETLIEGKRAHAYPAIQKLLQLFPQMDNFKRREYLTLSVKLEPESREAKLFELLEYHEKTPFKPGELRRYIARHYKLNELEDLNPVCQWMQAYTLYEELIAILLPRTVRSEKRLFLNLVDALVNTEQLDKAYALTLQSAPESPLSTAERLTARAEIVRRTEGSAAQRAMLELAVQSAELSDFANLERQLSAHGYTDLLEQLYQRYLTSERTASWGHHELIRLHYRQGNEGALRTQFPLAKDNLNDRQPAQKFIYYYLNLLWSRDIAETRQALEDLALEYPRDIGLRTLLAFAYERSGQTEIAFRILQESGPLPDILRRQRFFIVARAAIHTANNQPIESNLAFANLERGILLPSERDVIDNLDGNG